MSALRQLTSTSGVQSVMTFCWFKYAINATDCPMSADQGNYECLHAKPENNSLKITLLDFQDKDV